MTEELAELNLLGVVYHAIGNLNLNDPAAALKTLMRGLELYNRSKENNSQSQSAAKEAA
jgi:hypothetical protein